MKTSFLVTILAAGATLLTGCGGGSSDSGSLSPPSAASHLSVSAAAGSVVSGNALSFKVQALDDSNSPVSTFAGSLQLASSDTNALLPAQLSISGGQATFSVTFNTAGSQTLSASSGPIRGISAAIAVSPSRIAITSSSPPSGTVGTAYDTGWRAKCLRSYYWLCERWQRWFQRGFPLAASGSNQLTWTWSAQPGSSLPPGLSLSGSYIVGTPTQAGSYAVFITVSDTASAHATAGYNLTISNPAPPSIAAQPGPQGATLNQPYSYTFATTGYAVKVSATGKLPAGLAPVTSGGVIAGTPTVTGAFPIVVTVLDGVGRTVTQNFSIQVFPHGFGPTGAVQNLRVYHTATLLSSGRVLVAGGEDQTATDMASAETFDPSTQTFTATGNMGAARAYHTATLLCDLHALPCANPKVLIAAGMDAGGELSTAELFDPSNGTFAPTGSLSAARYRHTSTLLPNGLVLVAGGTTSAGSAVAAAELFNPATGTFAPAGNLVTPRYGHTATLLASGKVLLAGGLDGGGNVLASAELYDPVAATFTSTPNMLATRLDHTATLLTNGKILIVGGTGSAGATAELYDPGSATFVATANLPLWRSQHGAALLPDGKVLIAGGYYAPGNSDMADAELYDPQTGAFSETGGLQNARQNVLLTALGSSGRVLLAGGFPPLAGATAAELYQ